MKVHNLQSDSIPFPFHSSVLVFFYHFFPLCGEQGCGSFDCESSCGNGWSGFPVCVGGVVVQI